MQIAFDARRIVEDGRPVLVLAGEVHYFRLERTQWHDRLLQARGLGVDTIATYIPWIWHELPDGSFDLDGRTRPERDLGAYLDLCGSLGLRVFARPGPFVMAELKNEGIPFRVRRQHPHLPPIGWDATPGRTRTLDYTHPDFLREADRWLDAVTPVLTRRQATHGGPVTGVQLDNEVGMLAWVDNAPDLTDHDVADFAGWLRERHDDAEIARRYGTGTDDEGFATAVRAGGAASLAVHDDIGRFSRARFAHYLRHLEEGMRARDVEVPLFVNVHGTDQKRGLTFPIGVSQLAPAYRGRPGMAAGSDHYLGDLTVTNAADLYVMNAVLAAVNDADQPLTSLEFEVGSGDYDEDLEQLVPPEAATLKLALSAAQGARMVNLYLLSGGRNPVVDESAGDGIDRLAFTGERHGFAAPFDPEGAPTAASLELARAIAALRAHEPILAGGVQETDDVVLGFVADHYLTEYSHPASAERAAFVRELAAHRGQGVRSTLGRALVFGGFSFGAVDLQAEAGDREWAPGAVPVLDADPARRPLIALATGRSLPRDVQRWLAEHVTGGGRLLLTGAVPDRAEDGTGCRILADALGVRGAGEVRVRIGADANYWPTVRIAETLAPLAEVRVSTAQLVEAPADAVVLVTERQSAAPCAVHVRAGAGRAIVLGCDLPLHLPVWRALLATLDVPRRWAHDAASPGVIVVPVREGRTGLLTVVNVAPSAVDLTFETEEARAFTRGRLRVPARTALFLRAEARNQSRE